MDNHSKYKESHKHFHTGHTMLSLCLAGLIGVLLPLAIIGVGLGIDKLSKQESSAKPTRENTDAPPLPKAPPPLPATPTLTPPDHSPPLPADKWTPIPVPTLTPPLNWP